MRGQYLTRGAIRPCHSGETDAIPARFFLCALCQAEVLICRRCDRGNIYCARGCAREARRIAQRLAGRRYQSSRRGRFNHAARARRYRARQKKVTHQGSPPPPTDDDLLSDGSAFTHTPRPASCLPQESAWCCHWCGRRCPSFARSGFLRRQRGSEP